MINFDESYNLAKILFKSWKFMFVLSISLLSMGRYLSIKILWDNPHAMEEGRKKP